MTKASHSKKPAKPIKKPAAKAAASKSAPAKKAPAKAAHAKLAAKAPAKPVKAAAKPVAKPAAKADAHKKPVKVEKLTKAQIAAKAKEEKQKAKAAATKADPKKVEGAAVLPQAKPGSKIAPKKPGENETPGDADSPLLDMSDVGVRKMIAKAKARGYVTYDELNKVLP